MLLAICGRESVLGGGGGGHCTTTACRRLPPLAGNCVARWVLIGARARVLLVQVSRQQVRIGGGGRLPRGAFTPPQTCSSIAKFHYTDTGPTRTRTFLRRNSVGSVRVRVRVVEFSGFRGESKENK